ncbi:MAG TPA: lamin tail domain-containing protein [Candidatus Saccharimonadales bacterium]|nr:lamin tail domain-containing protein [Candidatus Saccharimonadales bacterium]
MKVKSMRFLSVITAGVMLGWTMFSPDLAAAASLVGLASATSPVIITEVLTGTKTSGTQEFIELYNTTDASIDLTGWQLWYLSAQAADQNKPASNGMIMLGESASSPVIAAHGFYALSGRSDYLAGIAQQFYGGTMAATGGNVRLLSPDEHNPCVLNVTDQVGWGNALYGLGQPAVAPPSGQSISRLIYGDGTYQDTHNNSADFAVTPTPTPANTNTAPATLLTSPSTFQPTAVTIENCIVPTESGSGLLGVPGANDVPPSTVVSGGIDANAAYNSESDFPSTDIGLVTPQITELLPNPAAPQTDARDEFIELYNSNDTMFDLSGFALQVGLTTKHKYVFPPGTTLLPKSFTSFSSAATGLTMSNSGGQAALLDPFGDTLNQTDPYGNAKEGQVWALAGSTWYWSTTATPNAANIITAASPSKKAVAVTAAATKKSAAAKTVAAAKPKTTKAKAKAKSETPKTPTGKGSFASLSPLHPGVLAVVGMFAILYGLYEYRQDMANKFYQLRENRTARRAARAEPEGG